MEDLQQDHLMGIDLEIDNPVRQNLNDSAKWAKFISIIMFIVCGLLLLFGALGGATLLATAKRLGSGYEFLDEFDGAIIIVVVVIVVAILAFVYYFLYNFSRKIKTALLTESTAELNAGLKSLKIFFIITTVFSILSLLNSIAQLFK